MLRSASVSTPSATTSTWRSCASVVICPTTLRFTGWCRRRARATCRADDLGLERREAGEPRIPRSQIVDREPEPIARSRATRSRTSDTSSREARSVISRMTFGAMRARGDSAEKSVSSARSRVWRLTKSTAPGTAPSGPPPPPARRARAPEAGRVFRPRRGWPRGVGGSARWREGAPRTEDRAVGRVDDRLIGHPQRTEDPVEARFEARPVGRLDVDWPSSASLLVSPAPSGEARRPAARSRRSARGRRASGCTCRRRSRSPRWRWRRPGPP